jgi:hypothetical protein
MVLAPCDSAVRWRIRRCLRILSIVIHRGAVARAPNQCGRPARSDRRRRTLPRRHACCSKRIADDAHAHGQFVTFNRQEFGAGRGENGAAPSSGRRRRSWCRLSLADAGRRCRSSTWLRHGARATHLAGTGASSTCWARARNA